MGIFRKKPVVSVPDENTADRAQLRQKAIADLRRAQALKRRSAAMAADLDQHGETNHYIERLREAWGVSS